MRSNGLLKPLRRVLGMDKGNAATAPGAVPASGSAAGAPASPISPPAANTPVHLQHVYAPEPNALKLQVNRLLLPLGEKRRYETADAAGDSPLAQAIFALGGIESVEIDSAFVTAMMKDDADWDALMERIPNTIQQHLEAGNPAVAAAAGAKKYRFGFQQVTRTPEEQFRLVQQLFETEINPAVAQHGGHFTLLEVKENRVFVELGGGCQGCGMADVTLRQGVEQRLKEVLPEMIALVDVTDHASGENPYYQPSK
jgi:Fe-S cluster biogenesis protein NfuA